MKKIEKLIYTVIILFIVYQVLLGINVYYSSCYQLRDMKPHRHRGPCNYGDYF